MLNCEKCETVRALLDAGAAPDARDDLGQTSFYVALQKRNYGIMRELVRGGADINLHVNEKQETYLHLAILKCETPGLVKFLLDLGAEVNCKDIYGLTPVQKAALTGDALLLELLAENGADLRVRDTNGWTLLHCAARYGHVQAVAWLLGKRVDTEARSGNGRTPLHFAAQNGQAGVVELLLEAGAKPDSKDDGGWTPLRWASYKGHKAVVQRILEWSNGIMQKLKSNKCSETVLALLEAGAMPDVKDSLGRTPFLMALEKQNYGVMQELIKGGADINLPVNDKQETYLHLAIRKSGNPGLVRYLLDLGADINSKDSYGLLPIQKALLTEDILLLDTLVDNGVDLEVRDRNGWTLLHCAARYGNVQGLTWLVDKGADVEAINNTGMTPLHYAAQYGQDAIVKLLLEAGAKPDSKDKNGWTPVQWANYCGSKTTAHLILTFIDL